MKMLTLCLLLCCARPVQAAPDYTLSIMAMFQNEGQWLKEWIEYHKLVGVEHFFLYNHLSQDNYEEVLAPYIACGDVELIQWRGATQRGSQPKAFADCLSRFGHRSTWIAFTDIDEFLLPVQEDNLQDLLKDYEEFGALAVNFHVYGTSGLQRLEEGELLIEQLTKCAHPHHACNIGVKCIVRPDRVLAPITVHEFEYLDDWYAVDSDKKRVEYYRNGNRRIPHDRIRLNHYQLRTLDWTYSELLTRMRRPERDENGNPVRFTRTEKIVRRQLGRIEGFANQTRDWTIFRFIEPLKRRLNLDADDEGAVVSDRDLSL